MFQLTSIMVSGMVSSTWSQQAWKYVPSITPFLESIPSTGLYARLQFCAPWVMLKEKGMAGWLATDTFIYEPREVSLTGRGWVHSIQA